ncbi:replication initiator [Winogradskya humida]|uniref:Plasmid replication initiator protein n=1 Tax=Winogradskya humida TaxID=113566 RepID=A0ABQ3ZU34_9ACTN|nr:replication initiator [Actinoplanes humidus]GIE22120.1 hypothetical protein Ahu01nite_052220 [Actinoplanes humidus]
MDSLLDLASRENSARGAGSNPETAYAWTPPAPAYTAAGSALARAARPDYFAWLEHVKAAGACTRPIRLSGSLTTVEPDTGRLLSERHTDELPDSAIYKACGNRRHAVCPSCARTYQRDAYQLLRAGLVGGKGIPATVTRHPAVFLTLTAPSFGTVHSRTVKKHTCHDRRRCDCRAEPCHARRDTGLCEHEKPAVCWSRHEPDDPLLGQPLCQDCYDYDHQAVFNLYAPQLWHHTKQAAERALTKLCRQRGIPFHPVVSASGKTTWKAPVRVSPGKVAEMQRRGAVHFHALVRLDGVNPDDPDAILAPPEAIGADDLINALEQAAHDITVNTPAHPDRAAGWPVGWGEQVDIRPITLTGDGEMTDGMAAGYLAKYATKSTEATGHTSTRITAENVDDYADAQGDHTARLIDACWRLGRPTQHSAPLAGRFVTHPEPGDRLIPFDTPWTCQDCGTRTRYAACPVCVAERQASLDSQPAKRPTAVNPYARLRRWAHMLGYGGHFLTKGRRYSVTFGALRAARIAFRRVDHPSPTNDHLGTAAITGPVEVQTTLLIGTLSFAGVGWHTSGDALLANTAAAMARERRDAGCEELAHERAETLPIPLAA